MNPIIGMTVVDKITGFRGVVTGHVEYITGCNQCLVSPRVTPEGNIPDSHWFDIQRLTVMAGVEGIVIDNGPTPGFDKAPPKK